MMALKLSCTLKLTLASLRRYLYLKCTLGKTSNRPMSSICKVHRKLKMSSNETPFDTNWVNNRFYQTEAMAVPDIDFDELKQPQIIYSAQMEFVDPEQWGKIPTYRILDEEGRLTSNIVPGVSNETALDMYKNMRMMSIVDWLVNCAYSTTNPIVRVCFESQRQGRLTFYLTQTGEEAVSAGIASGLQAEDLVYAQYRESSLILARGLTVDDLMNQCFSNSGDAFKGKCMPLHYGSKDLNFVQISSPLATQMPQAVGSAYSYMIQQRDGVVAVIFGDGASSEGDAHAALNFASTLKVPLVFICRNNGYAISTPTECQYNGDGVAARGPAYGMKTLRVDGNDALAVCTAVEAARDICKKTSRPILIEAMTYRISHHSTSDDSSTYRPESEINYFRENEDPIVRLFRYLNQLNIWDASKEKEFVAKARKDVLAAMSRAEKMKRPSIGKMFEDVYKRFPRRLELQEEQLKQHLIAYGHFYKDLKNFDNETA